MPGGGRGTPRKAGAGEGSSSSKNARTPSQQQPGNARASLYGNATPSTSAAVADALSEQQREQLKRQGNLSTLSISPRTAARSSAPPALAAAATPSSASTRRKSSSSNSKGKAKQQQREVLAEEDEWTMVDRMRCWRNDAMTQHLYGTAQFWGTKLFNLTGDPNDAFWLAQTHFLTHQFAQAERILALPRADGAERLADTSVACRYLAAQCQVRLGKWDEALELVGRGDDPWSSPATGDDDVRTVHEEEDEVEGTADGGVKFVASIAYLRGLIHLHLGATDLAKLCLMDALARDVKCFDAFELLVGTEMMTPDEEWDFVQQLAYGQHTPDDAELVRMMYTLRLKKFKHRDEMDEARERLSKDYELGDDPDVLFSRADELYTALRFADCFAVTSRIVARHPTHRATLPLHLSCMYHLPKLRSRLFVLAHQLVDTDPDDALSWYAVGLWYFTGRRWEEARRYFGKSVLLDARFGPAWVAFAHTYAFEGEHDQAITAYSTALRHFQGTHLPLLFIGMQHLGLANVRLAEEYLRAAHGMCADDALVLNELGVLEMHKENFHTAAQYFEQTLAVATRVQAREATWATTHLNLGHALVRLGRHADARRAFTRVIELEPRHAGALTALGMLEHRFGRPQRAIVRYHEALTVNAADPVVCDLLRFALTDTLDNVDDASHLPGLSLAVKRDLDMGVDALDRDILAGNPVPDDMDENLRRLNEDVSSVNGVSIEGMRIEFEPTNTTTTAEDDSLMMLDDG